MKWFLIFSLIISEIVFAQYSSTPSAAPIRTYDQGHAIRGNQMIGAYNAPARIDVRGSWDFFLSGTFIYWQAREEGLELAFATELSPAMGDFPVKGKTVNTRFCYNPGFKIGGGIHFRNDDWGLFFQYTWLDMTTRTKRGSPEGGFLIPFWFSGQNAAIANGICTQIKSKWHVDLDLFDAELTRPYYIGKALIFRPHIGGRGGWIDQRYNLTGVFTGNGLNDSVLSFYDRNSSKMWMAGPRAGLDTSWLLGYGFRFFGDTSAALLYTRYRLTIKEDPITLDPNIPVSIMKDKVGYLRPNAEFRLGLGWGSYFSRKTWHIDFETSYDWQIFWNQNMMRSFSDSKERVSGNIGDFYLAGLTATLRFDF
jgi:hypothetical protein